MCQAAFTISPDHSGKLSFFDRCHVFPPSAER